MKANRFRNKIADIIIPSKAILVMAVIGLLIVGVSVFLEYQDRRKDLLKLLENQSALFIRTLSSSARNTIIAADRFENELNNRIIASLHLVEQLDRQSKLTRVDLVRLLKSIQVDELHIYNSEYSVLCMAAGDDRTLKPIPKDVLKSRFENESGSESPISIEFPGRPEKLNAFLVPRKRGGVIVALVADDRFSSLRSMLGFGYFLKRFQTAENVEYVVLQNSQTIIAGSFKNYKLSSFASDSLLHQAMADNEMKTRIIKYDDHPIYEAISRFEMYDMSIGVLRLGLSMHEYEQLAEAARTRLYIFAAVIVVIGIIFVNFAAINRHRHLLRKDLNRLQDHTNTILNNLQSGVLSIDQDGIIQSANKQALSLLEYDISDLYRKPFDVLSEEIWNAITECMQTDGTNNTDSRDRILIHWKNRTIHLRSRIITDDATHRTYIILLDDITGQKLLEEQIRQNEKLSAMQKIALSVAHEIRNPLTAINLIIDLLRKQSNSMVQVDSSDLNLETVQKEIKRISVIVEKYLRYGKLPELKIGVIQFPLLFLDIKSMYEAQLDRKMILLVMDIKNHPPIKGDADQLKQVFINLLNNAEEAIGEKGRIEILGSMSGEVYEIEIRDSGKGIPQKHIESIFDFNFTTKQSGRGIGLAVVRQILNAHHATIDVESSEGKGATFILRFPIE
jgi:PAS domain S-box-containing protein